MNFYFKKEPNWYLVCDPDCPKKMLENQPIEYFGSIELLFKRFGTCKTVFQRKFKKGEASEQIKGVKGYYESNTNPKPNEEHRAFFTVNPDYADFDCGQEIHEWMCYDSERLAFFDIDLKVDQLDEAAKILGCDNKADDCCKEIIKLISNQLVEYGFEHKRTLDHVVLGRKHSEKYSYHIIFNSIGFSSCESQRTFHNKMVARDAKLNALRNTKGGKVLDLLHKSQQGFAIFGSAKENGVKIKYLWGNPKEDSFVYYLVGNAGISQGCQISKCDEIPYIEGNNITGITEEGKRLDDLFKKIMPEVRENFTIRDMTSTNMIRYNRIRSSYCEICDSTHDKDNTAFLTYTNKKLYLRCRKNAEKVTADQKPSIMLIDEEEFEIFGDDYFMSAEEKDAQEDAQEVVKRRPGRPKKAKQETTSSNSLASQIFKKYNESDRTSVCRFDPIDKYTFKDFKDTFREGFLTERQMYEFVAEKSRRVYCHIDGLGPIGKRSFSALNKMHYLLGNTDLDVKIKVEDRKYCLRDLLGSLGRTSQIIACDPESINNPGVLSVYPGLFSENAFRSNPNAEFDFTELVDFIKGLIGNEVNYRYFMRWLQIAMSNSNERTNKLMYLYSKCHGVGKSTLVNILLYYFGSLGTTIAGLSALFRDHSEISSGKKFICVDEAKEWSDKMHTDLEELLKVTVTSDISLFNPKNKTEYQMLNTCNFLITANYLSLKIRSEQRRIVIFECTNKYLRDADFCVQLIKKYKTEEAAAAFYKYMMNLDLKDVNFENQPVTEIMELAMEQTQYSWEYFFSELIEKYSVCRIDYNYEVIGKAIVDKSGKKETEIKQFDEKETKEMKEIVSRWQLETIKPILGAKDLYEHYSHSCKTGGFLHVLNIKDFGCKAKQVFGSKRATEGNRYNLTHILAKCEKVKDE